MNMLERRQGIHFYINVSNFDQVVSAEEEETRRVNHAIHALDTYFRSIERFSKANFGDVLTIEKITGARLHLYVVDDVASAYHCVEIVVSYAFLLSKLVNKEIPKYKKLKDFEIQVGACFGHFYEFVFVHKNDNREKDFEELTTIGFAANLAAKLQGLAGVYNICISEDIYDEIVDGTRIYARCENTGLAKYKQKYYYEARLEDLYQLHGVLVDMDEVKEYANEVNLTDMNFPEARKTLTFDSLSKTNGKRIIGVPLFADVRDFTSKFHEDDSNLVEMARKTEDILTKMYDVVKRNGGIHVQFQGDREEVLFHDIGEDSCYEKAVLTGMRLIDVVKGLGVHIGVGTDYGVLYATKIGARGEKDNILIGRTVISADRLEDKAAGCDQIAISEELYHCLVDANSELVDFFEKTSLGVYVATISYKEYLSTVTSRQHRLSTNKGDYNGAWGE